MSRRVSTAVMYGTYNGIKQALTSDDIAGIDSIYGTRQFDQFNNGGHRNSTFFTATNINSYITSNAQIAIPGLDITTPGQAEWFYVNVPSTTTGTMTVTVQSSNLSSLAPLLQIYNSSLSLLGQTSAPEHVRGDDQPVDERGVGSGLLRQGHGRGRGRHRLAVTACYSTSAARRSRRSRPPTRLLPNNRIGRRHGRRQRPRRRSNRIGLELGSVDQPSSHQSPLTAIPTDSTR